MSIPSRLNTIFLLLASPATFILRCFSSSSFLCCFSSWASRLPPTVPTPIRNTFSSMFSERKNDSWTTFRVFRNSEVFTTHEILSSEAPCAIAIILMPFLPIVEKSFPATPVVCFIFSPTIATIDNSLSISILLICPVFISFSNSALIAASAASVSGLSIATLIEFSEDACEIRITFIPAPARAEKSLIEMPVTPTMPIPCRVTSEIPEMDEIPLIGVSFIVLILLKIRVPSFSGLNVFFICTGIPFW